jgi:excisionase family DNA binding protein
MRNLSRDLSADEQEAARLIKQLAADLADCVLRAGAILAGMVVRVVQEPSVPTLLTSRSDVKSEITVLTVREAAGMLGVSIPGMRLRIARREIAVVRLGRIIRIPRTEIERLIAENLVPVRRR